MDIVKLEDSDDIQKIAQQLIDMDPWRKLSYKKETLVKYLLSNSSCVSYYKVVDSGEIVGILCIKQPWWQGLYVEVFAIFSRFQRKGLGNKVMHWVQKEAEQKNLKNVWLLVSDFNHSAYQFYLNQGFIEIGRLKGLLDVAHDELLLRKQLNV